jgi:low-affinity ferrous iron transport protein
MHFFTNVQSMQQLLKLLRAPGARRPIEYAAPTQVVVKVDQHGKDEGVNSSVEGANTYTVLAKTRLLDRWLDKVVQYSGSEFIFCTIIVALLTWAFLGIPFGKSNNWQVGISDAQAIIYMTFY